VSPERSPGAAFHPPCFHGGPDQPEMGLGRGQRWPEGMVTVPGDQELPASPKAAARGHRSKPPVPSSKPALLCAF